MGGTVSEVQSELLERKRDKWEPLFARAASVSDPEQLVPIIRELKKISVGPGRESIFRLLLLRLGVKIGQSMVANAFNLYADTLRLEKSRVAKRKKKD